MGHFKHGFPHPKSLLIDAMETRPLLFITALLLCLFSLSSCALITVPVKVAGKVVTTSIGIVGKVAEVGIGAVTPGKSDDDDDQKEKKDKDEGEDNKDDKD